MCSEMWGKTTVMVFSFIGSLGFVRPSARARALACVYVCVCMCFTYRTRRHCIILSFVSPDFIRFMAVAAVDIEIAM
jgi:hypothetical protein